MNKFEENINAAWKKYQSEKKDELYPNIMLLGISGAGKSSLINSVFKRNLADVSNVKPETQGFDNIYYGQKYGLSVNLIDTAGYEMNQGDTYGNTVNETLKNGVRNEKIHIIWYCISIANERIEDMDIKLNPIFRETYTLRDAGVKEKGYYITDACAGCGACAAICPQRCIEEGAPYRIHRNHCLRCGNCYENCPAHAIERK